MARRTHVEMTETTRALLLARARAAFAAHGYAGAPIEEVVGAAGLTKGALYHHFGSKQGLFEAVVRDLDRELAERIAADTSASDQPWGELLAACRLFLESTLEPGVRRILLIDGPAVLGHARSRSLDDELLVRPLIEAVEAYRAAGRTIDVDVEALARLLAGALVEAALWLGDSPRPQDALDRSLATLGQLLDGVVAPPRSRR